MSKTVRMNTSVGGMEGYVEFKMPTPSERFALLREVNVEEKSGEAELNKMDRAEKTYEAVFSRITEVNVEHVDTGTKITDAESLSCYVEGNEIISEVSSAVYGGIRLGKPSDPK